MQEQQQEVQEPVNSAVIENVENQWMLDKEENAENDEADEEEELGDVRMAEEIMMEEVEELADQGKDQPSANEVSIFVLLGIFCSYLDSGNRISPASRCSAHR